MAENTEKNDDLAVIEAQDGSATVDVPESLLAEEPVDEQNGFDRAKDGGNVSSDADADNPNDNDELRAAKRNRRQAKKDLVRKTNQEKDVRLQQLARENEQMRQDIDQLKRNTKAEHVVRIEKNIEDAQTRLEYAKMKLAEAASMNDGQAMVEAQTLWQNSQKEVDHLSNLKLQADRELSRPQQNDTSDPAVTRRANEWVRRNSWYDNGLRDPDSKIAKKMDELMMAQGWNPSDPEYWDELDSRLQKELPHRYNGRNDDENRNVRRPRNVVGSAGREASAAYGGSNRSQFVLSPERVKAMKDAGAWENPERKARMVKQFIAYDRMNRNN